MRTTSRLLVTLLLGVLVGLPMFTVSAEDFDGKFVLEADLSFLGEYRYMHVSPAGDMICIVTEDEISIVDVDTHSILVAKTFSDTIGRPGCWVGDKIYVGMSRTEGGPNYLNYLVVLDPADLSEVTAFKAPRYDFHTLSASPTGDHIAMTSHSSGPNSRPELYVLRTSDNEVVYDFTDDKSGTHAWLAWSQDGQQIASVSDEDVNVHNIKTGTNFSFPKRNTRTSTLVFTPDGDGLYSFNREGDLDLYDLVKRELVSTTYLARKIICGDIDFQRNILGIGEWSDLRLYSMDTFDLLELHPDAADDIGQIDWLDGDNRLATISQDGFLRLYRDTSDPKWDKPPVITITSPKWGQEMEGDLYASGTITDDSPSVAGSYRLNGGPMTQLESPEAWSFEVDEGHLIQGSNQLTLTASDGESETTKTVFFRYTGEPATNARPMVEILSPANGSEVGEVISLSGTASDDIGVDSVSIRIGDGPWIKASGKEEWDHVVIVPADVMDWMTVQAKASDGSLESPVSEIMLYVDRGGSQWNRPPRIILSDPVDGAHVSDRMVCRGTTEDDGPDTMTFIAFDGGTWSVISSGQTWERSYTTAGWSPGSHTVSFMAFDGELSSQILNVEVIKLDSSIPLITIVTPGPAVRFSGPLEISGNAVSGRGPILRVEVRITRRGATNSTRRAGQSETS